MLLTSTAGWTQSYERTSTGLKASLPTMNVEVRFYSPRIVRVLKTPKGNKVPTTSLSVTKQPQSTTLTLTKTDSTVTLTGLELRVVLHLGRGSVAISKAKGEALLRESRQLASFAANQGPEAGSFDVKQGFALDEDEVIYDLGQQQNDKLNQRGQQMRLAQGNTAVAIPFFQSVKGYGVF